MSTQQSSSISGCFTTTVPTPKSPPHSNREGTYKQQVNSNPPPSQWGRWRVSVGGGRKNTLRTSFLSMFALVFLLTACNLTNDPVELTPEPTADLPRVQILAPANNQQVIEDTEFTFDVVGRDENPGIAYIELRIDDETLDEVPPAEDEFVPVLRTEIPWRATGVGLHVIEAIAYRPDGTPSDPAIINIEVLPRE